MQQIDILFNDAVEFMSITNNIVQFFAFIAGIIAAFFILSNKYVRPVSSLLGSLGIKRRYVLYSIILCRRNPRKHIRVLCEYFILKSCGQHKDKLWWKNACTEFIAFYKDSFPDNFIYEIDNCTDILSEDIFNKINDYFDYFDQEKMRKKYNLDRNLPISFCMEIRIKQGYLSPNFLLSGLLDRYKNDWGNLVKKYVSSANNKTDSDHLYSSEIYYTFAWLLWGPSYQLKHQDKNFKLCQYAFGDESNSINVVLNNDEKLADLWRNISVDSNGVLCSLTCKLYKARKYVDFYRENFNPLNIYFTNKVANESTCFLLEPTEYDIKNNYIAQNYYCTAYVWIMFESVVDQNSCFQPQQAVTFFEHANLANRINYEACINSLITKSFEHFDKMLSDDSIKRKYHYCLSMNDYIENKFIERFQAKTAEDNELSQKYKSCFVMNKACAESDVFSSLDAYFSNSEDDLDFTEVNVQDKHTISLLGEYYTSIYINSFPDKNERESLDNIIEYLHKKDNGWYGKSNYHVLLALKSGKPVGGLVCDYFGNSNCGVVEFIDVKQEYQSEGIGTRLYQRALELLRNDSKKNLKNNIDYILCEIEKEEENKTNNKKYLWFWRKMGYRKLLFNYIQPALDDNKENVYALNLIAAKFNEDIKIEKGISVPTLKSFLYDYAKLAMRIEKPEENASIIKMTEELESVETQIIKTDIIVS